MPVVSIIGPKGGIGKTTLSINTAAALTRLLPPRDRDNRVCLVDLDLRLPTISSLLDSHPHNTFYDLFETLANQTFQVDFLRSVYQILSRFTHHLDGLIPETDKGLAESLSLYKNLNTDHFNFTELPFGEALYELFLERGQIRIPADIRKLVPVLFRIDLCEFKEALNKREENSIPRVDEYIKYIEEYQLSLIGGEIPILGKKSHRQRINDPEYLLVFLDVLSEVFRRFDYVILDTPAGGVNHLSPLMNSIDQTLFVFDLSNTIAVNGSIDAIHSFIDYYEDFYEDYREGRLTGLDKAHVNRLLAQKGERAIETSLRNKKLSLLFNRFQEPRDLNKALDHLREYLETLDKWQGYKDRIHIVGMLPHHKVINITNNHGAMFYKKEQTLTAHMDQVAGCLIENQEQCPTLSQSNRDILDFLKSKGWLSWTRGLGKAAV